MNKHIGKIAIGLLVVAFGGYCYHLSQPPVQMTEDYVVKPGDTLWDIASVHNGGDFNTGEVIYWIQQKNNIPMNGIQPGEELHVPSADQK